LPGTTANITGNIAGPGNFALLGLSQGTATRTINVNGAPSGDAVLITAPIVTGGTVGAVGSLTKGGSTASRLVLDPVSNSSFNGAVTVAAGILNIRKNSALGTATAVAADGTQVNAGATLELQGGVTVTDERLNLPGTAGAYGNYPVLSSTWTDGLAWGYAVNNGLVGTGTVRAVSGDNIWTASLGATQIVVHSGADIGFSADQGAKLNIRGTMNMAGGLSIFKTGQGTLEFSSVGNVAGSSNGVGGNSALRHLAGTVILNKAGTDEAFINAVIVGDGVGVDTLSYGPDAGNNQIRDNQNVILQSSGVFNLNGKSDIVAAVFGESGPTSASQINTGAGTLQVNGDWNVAVRGLGAAVTTNPSMVVSGNVNLGNATRNFNVRDSLADVDLDITAQINASQTLTVAATVTAFTLSLNGVVTAAIP
jgi:hypothetical protein